MRLAAHAPLCRLVEGQKGRSRVTRARRKGCEQVVEALVAGLHGELAGGDAAQAARLP